jgi:hypothetical protein
MADGKLGQFVSTLLMWYKLCDSKGLFRNKECQRWHVMGASLL